VLLITDEAYFFLAITVIICIIRPNRRKCNIFVTINKI